jgi:hypothetical protein
MYPKGSQVHCNSRQKVLSSVKTQKCLHSGKIVKRLMKYGVGRVRLFTWAIVRIGSPVEKQDTTLHLNFR